MSEKKSEEVKVSEETNTEECEFTIPVNTGTLGILVTAIIIVVGMSLRISTKKYSAELSEIREQHQLSPKTESAMLTKIKKQLSVAEKELSFEKKSNINQIKQIVLAKDEIDNRDEQIKLLKQETSNKREQIRLLQESQGNKNAIINVLRARNEKLRKASRLAANKAEKK